MNAVLIVREEIVCLLVLFFLAFYYSLCGSKKEVKREDPFFRIMLFSILHVIFDIITVFTVNNRDVVPLVLNLWLHVMLLCTGIMFITEFLNYVIKLTCPIRVLKSMRRLQYFPVLIIVICAFFVPIEYVEGNGTCYSFGPLVFLCYGIFVVFCLLSVILSFVKYKNLDKKTRIAILPTTVLMVLMLFAQMLYPELLITGAGLTFVCLGLFITLNDPVNEYKEQALWDEATGIRNKNYYLKQLAIMQKKYANKKVTVGFVVCDLNGLKHINDKYGHIEGDKLIKAAANILQEHLDGADGVYRTGGDEFMAIYISAAENIITEDIQRVRAACENYTDSPIPLSIAMGHGIDNVTYDGFKQVCEKADAMMYENKAEIKKMHPELSRE